MAHTTYRQERDNDTDDCYYCGGRVWVSEAVYLTDLVDEPAAHEPCADDHGGHYER